MKSAANCGDSAIGVAHAPLISSIVSKEINKDDVKGEIKEMACKV